MKYLFIVTAIIALFSPTVTHAESDKEIRQILIQRSLSTYPGNCPCPYNTDRAGRSCGRRSAYSKPGGYSPLCYPSDITPAMIAAYRSQHDMERGNSDKR